MSTQTIADITIEQPNEQRLAELGVSAWPIWEKEVSTFPWHYDSQEMCYILAGQATVTAAGGSVLFGQGDFVTFPEGLDCTWQITSAIRKHYSFG